MEKIEVNIIIEKHQMWLESKDSEDVKGEKADFTGRDLNHFVFEDVDLTESVFDSAILTSAKFVNCNLTGTSFYRAKLQNSVFKNCIFNETSFCKGNLEGSILSNNEFFNVDFSFSKMIYSRMVQCNFEKSNFDCSRLEHANFLRSKFKDVTFCFANLISACFYESVLMNIDFGYSTLTNADFMGSDMRCMSASVYTSFYHLQCPEEGEFIGYKKCYRDMKYYIVKLLITKDSLRSSATTRKCRCSKAKVLSITNLDGTKANVDEVFSTHNFNFTYKVGEIKEVKNFDIDRWNECSTGIHFFITRQEAVDYNLY